VSPAFGARPWPLALPPDVKGVMLLTGSKTTPTSKEPVPEFISIYTQVNYLGGVRDSIELVEPLGKALRVNRHTDFPYFPMGPSPPPPRRALVGCIRSTEVARIVTGCSMGSSRFNGSGETRCGERRGLDAVELLSDARLNTASANRKFCRSGAPARASGECKLQAIPLGIASQQLSSVIPIHNDGGQTT
jgi:hypothetical protein